MDFLYFLRDHLRFIRYFYEIAMQPFEEIKRKIRAGEAPYVDQRDPDRDDYEPAFLAEWEDADVAMDVIGMTCLGMLQTAFQSFLREHVKAIGGDTLFKHVSQMKQGSWFANYRTLFVNELRTDWAGSGVDLDLLEQVILTRNDFQHKVEITSAIVYQSKKHAEKYPDTPFRDPGWPVSAFMPARLIYRRA